MFASRQCLVLTIALIAILEASIASAQLQARGQPLLVRFTGTFQPFDEKAAGNLNTLTVSYQKRQWLFHVERVNVLGGRDPGTLLLSRIFPPRLSLSAPSQFLEPLGASESLGKQFTLEGLLYLKTRRFNVTTVKEEATTDHEQETHDASP